MSRRFSVITWLRKFSTSVYYVSRIFSLTVFFSRDSTRHKYFGVAHFLDTISNRSRPETETHSYPTLRMVLMQVVTKAKSHILFQHLSRIRKERVTRESKSTNNYMYDEISKNLVISAVQLQDEGVYHCTVNDHQAKPSMVAIYIYVRGKKPKRMD